MNLVLDFGNTNVKWALFHDKNMIKFVSATILTKYAFEEILKKYSNIHNICVVGDSDLTEEIHHICLDNEINYLKLTNSIKLPININYRSPKTLGADRIALVMGAHKLYSKDTLIIDCGTCITYDLLVGNDYLGGQISPGLHMRLSSLHFFTKKLPKLNFDFQDYFIGDSTKKSMLIGVSDSILFEIKDVIQKYRLRYPNINVVITGGDAKFVKNKIKNINFINPYLLMEGLNYIIAFNEEI